MKQSRYRKARRKVRRWMFAHTPARESGRTTRDGPLTRFKRPSILWLIFDRFVPVRDVDTGEVVHWTLTPVTSAFRMTFPRWYSWWWKRMTVDASCGHCTRWRWRRMPISISLACRVPGHGPFDEKFWRYKAEQPVPFPVRMYRR